MHPNNITAGIALSLAPFTPLACGQEPDPSSTPATVKITAYEFPFCLASDKQVLQKLFVSRPTETTLTISPSSAAPGAAGSECVPINASEGIPHSFFYTVYGGSGRNVELTTTMTCELLTFEKEGCEGKVTAHSLDGIEGGVSKCFSRPDRFVKALLRSARVACS